MNARTHMEINALANMTSTQLRAKYEELTGDPVIFSVLSNNRAMGMCKRCGIAFAAEVASRENGVVNLDHFTPGWQDRRPLTIEQPPATQE